LNTLNSTETGSALPLGGLSRFNQILLGLLVLQLIIGAIIFWPQRQAEAVLSLSLTGFAQADVTGLTITDDKGEQLAIKKGGDGWELAEIAGFAVNAETVTELLDKVVGLETNRLVTRTKDSHKRLQVADDGFARQLIIETADGQSRTVYLGSSPNAGSTHIRLAGEDEAYLSSDLAVWQVDTRASAWINTDYFQIASTDIKAISLINPSGTLIFERVGEEDWALDGLAEGEELLVNNVKSLATRLASLRMAKPIGLAAEDWMGLDNPLVSITLTTEAEGEGPQTHAILVGGKNEAGEYVMKASSSPYYVWVAGFTVDDLLQRDRASFLAQPEGEPVSGE